MDPSDEGRYNQCALREILEETVIPTSWLALLERELASAPEGQSLVPLHRPSNGKNYLVAMWIIRLPPDVAHRCAVPTKQGLTEMVPETLTWRPVTEVAQNLTQFRTFAPYGAALSELIESLSRNPLLFESRSR